MTKKGWIGLILALIAQFTLTAFAYPELKVSGDFRNDSLVTFSTNDSMFNNILETKIILQRKSSDWKFYADFRLKLLSGQYANQITDLENTFMATLIAMDSNATALAATGGMFGSYSLSFPRAFVKFYTGIGDFTVGKTYINFGNPSVFNPLEMNKSINFTDLSYDKDGLIAVEYRFPFGALSGGTIFLSPDYPLSNTAGGLSLYGNVGSFDIGMVINRKAYNNNSLGFYFKGDLGVGIQAGYAFHFDDWYTNYFNEANIGIDYSFLEGKMITSLEFYYAETGATETNDYDPYSTDDRYFMARYYLYGNVIYAPNEFWSMGLDCFVNMIDYSGLVMPRVSYVILDGLTLTGQFGWLWKEGYAEFSGDTLGHYSLLLRVEAAL